MGILNNFNRIRTRVAEITSIKGRDPESVKIIAVTKTLPASTVQEAVDSGISLLGESRIQEARSKFVEIKGGYTLHMVGHLQSNKSRDAVRLFDLIHSIDRDTTAEAVNAEAEKAGKKQKILLQVKTSGEETRSGIEPGGLEGLVERVLGMKNLELLGLMTIAPFTEDGDLVRKSFRDAGELLCRINSGFGLSLAELSMGMSGDFEIAVEEGSTMLRIGTAIFGSRS
ncbi:MAG: YggS family pyridoxal phosphate-dependent enzyme [Spirochaetes bacterium]|jgi:hypothetical protein|nr:YggS family pyridoxal phosphate-dependent enzyme [Spirochaetota bacterium]